MNLRPLRALKDLDKRLDELHAADRAAEEWARFELARSASRYSRKTREVMDDTITLSATLMRAGELDEANRLIEEAEFRVRSEEVALIETVNEVKAAEQVRKRNLSRLKVVKVLSTAFLSGSMFMFSALGMTFARKVMDDDPTVRQPAAAVHDRAAPKDQNLREVEVAPGVKLRLTRTELRRFSLLADGADPEGLRAFLAKRLPKKMVDRVQAALMTVALQAETVAEEFTREIAQTVEQVPSRPSAPAPKPSDSETPKEESAAPDEDESESPPPEPSPEPNPSGGGSDDDPSGGNLPFSDVIFPED